MEDPIKPVIRPQIGRKANANFLQSNSPVSVAIFFVLISFVLFIESLLILLSVFKKGILKKEVLSKKSLLGFDIDIILKS